MAVDSEAVAFYDEIRAEVLEILYSMFDHRVNWGVSCIRIELKYPRYNIHGLHQLIESAWRELEDEGRVVREGFMAIRLTANAWLSMTRSEQRCSDSSLICRT